MLSFEGSFIFNKRMFNLTLPITYSHITHGRLNEFLQFFFSLELKSSFLTLGMSEWTNKVTSVSLKLFWLFLLIRVVGPHLKGCGRSCYFHDFITHESLINL